jgi:FG-GAP-like repeat
MRIRAGLLAITITMLVPAGLTLGPSAQAAAPTQAQATAPESARTASAPASSGTFRSVVYVKNVVGPGVAPPSSVAIADVTGDGRPDLIVSTVDPDNVNGGTTVAVYRQRDNGTLAAPVTAKAPPPDYNDDQTQITIADLYANGQKEILLTEAGHVDVFAYRHGRVTGPARIPVPGGSSPKSGGAGDLRVADMNRDGHPDLLVTDFYGHVVIYRGSAAHTFAYARKLDFGADAETWPVLFNSDFNHDGRMDVAVLNGESFSVRMQWSGSRFSNLRTYKVVPVGGVLFGTAGLAVGDVTGDGRPDVVTDTLANSPWSGVEVFAGTGSGTFKAPVVHPTLDVPMGLTITDLTGNGRNDLVIDHDQENAIGVMLQTSRGTLGPETLYPAITYGDTPAVGDLNGDRKPDIAFTAGPGEIGILYGK